MNTRLSNAQIIAANNAINEMLRHKLPRAAQLKLLRMIDKWFEPHMKPLVTIEQEMRKAHTDDKGEFYQDKFFEEWDKLLAEEDDYENAPQFKASLLGNDTDDLGLVLKWLGKFFKDDVSKDED